MRYSRDIQLTATQQLYKILITMPSTLNFSRLVVVSWLFIFLTVSQLVKAENSPSHDIRIVVTAAFVSEQGLPIYNELAL